MTGDECGVKWCEEHREHDGPHRKRLLDTFGMDVQTGRKVIVQCWLQGESARTNAVVLVNGVCEVGLTWSQTTRLANVLSGASGRFGESR